MHTQGALYFLWSEIRTEKFLCVWVKTTSEHTSWDKSTVLKIVIRTKWFDLIAFVYKRRDTSFMVYHPSYKQMGLFMLRETVYCKLFSRPGSVMGPETVYLCHDFSDVLKSWRDRNCKRIQKEVPFNRLEEVSNMSPSIFLLSTLYP